MGISRYIYITRTLFIFPGVWLLSANVCFPHTFTCTRTLFMWLPAFNSPSVCPSLELGNTFPCSHAFGVMWSLRLQENASGFNDLKDLLVCYRFFRAWLLRDRLGSQSWLTPELHWKLSLPFACSLCPSPKSAEYMNFLPIPCSSAAECLLHYPSFPSSRRLAFSGRAYPTTLNLRESSTGKR